jgi:hypothetical protein
MLKRVRAMAESAGIIVPSETDARTAAEQRRADLLAAQSAIQHAEQELEAGYDRGATPRELQAAEAVLADARLTAERAQRAFQSAEKRLRAAQDIEADKSRAAALAKRDEALAIRAKAAAEIDRLAADMAGVVAEYDAQANALSEAAAAGVASRTYYIDGAVLVRSALERAGAMPSSWVGDRADQPSAADLAARDADAVTAGLR